MAERTWTPAQQQCIHAHNGTLLVSAAAGSGKTTVLVERILRRVLKEESPTDVDRLLVVTFTNAASAEMKSRLSKAFAKAAAEHPHDARIQKQQILVPRADICTIDSFCIALVREQFQALGISPGFTILDTEKDRLLRAEALRETLAEFHAERCPAFMELYETLADGRGDRPLYGIVETVYNYVQSYPDPEMWFARVRDAFANAERIGQTPWGQVLLGKVAAGLSRACALCRSALSLCEYDTQLTTNYAPALRSDIAEWEAIRAFAKAGEWDRTFRALSLYKPEKLKSVKDSPMKDNVKTLREAAKGTVNKLSDYHCGSETECLDDLRFTERLTAIVCDMVRRFTVLFREKKDEAAAYGFDDIKHMALSLLTVREGNALVPSPLATEMSARYDEILIDECQDINATDEALFVALSRQKTNLFMVGDVKQCIYAFRQAMPDIFLKYRNEFPVFDGKQYPATIILGHNFRSRRTVLGTANFVFRQLMTPSFSGMAYDESEALVYGDLYQETADETPYTTECLVVDGQSSDNLSAHEAEAHIIAQRIRDLVGTLPVGTKEQRPLQYGDVCILLRNFSSHAPIYKQVLSDYGIPVGAATGSGFFGSAEIRLTVSLLRCIDNPLNDIPLTAVLLSPLFGFTPDDLTAVRLCRAKVPLYTALAAASRSAKPVLADRCRQTLNALDRFRTLAVGLTVDRLINRLYEELSLPELVCARYGGPLRAERLHFLYEYSRRFEKGGFRGLSSFVRYIDRLQEQGIDLEFAVGSGSENAVQLMSAHGSKGLEFPVVFVSGLQDAFKGDDTRSAVLLHNVYGMGLKHRDPVTLGTYPTLPFRGVSLLNRQTTLAEELRILYVAMTRAREKLYLVTHLSNPEKTLLTLGAYLDTDGITQSADTVNGASSMSDWVLMSLLRHPMGASLREIAGLSDRVALDDTSSLSVSLCTVTDEASMPDTQEDPTPDETLMDTVRRNLAYCYPHESLSRVPTKMAASRVADKITPQNAAVARPAFLGKGGLSPAERGTAMHLFLQCADWTRATADLPAEIERLTMGGFLSEAQASALDKARLTAFFGSELFRRMRDAETLYREYRFTFRAPAAWYDSTVTDEDEFVVVQGMTDCVFEDNGKLVLVDYKTDRVASPADLAERYAPQLRMYAKALEAVLERPVLECLLYSFHLNQTVSIE